MQNMFKMRISAILTVTILIVIFTKNYVYGDTIPLSNRINDMRISSINGNSPVGSSSSTENDLNTCEEQLSKYRRFLLQAILSFEDVCDAYTQRPLAVPAILMPDSVYRGLPVREQQGTGLFFSRNYQPSEQRSEIWTFFKLLMGQFDDMEFTSVIRNAIVERCRAKSLLQRDEKRNSVVLGKKQRFHSWGGKRSQAPVPDGETAFA